jgi:hypothetical protein
MRVQKVTSKRVPVLILPEIQQHRIPSPIPPLRQWNLQRQVVTISLMWTSLHNSPTVSVYLLLHLLLQRGCYGPDHLVQALGYLCQNNTRWKWRVIQFNQHDFQLQQEKLKLA